MLKDENAARWVESFARITQVWDDLVDRDKPITGDDVTMAFMDALIAMPNNPFFVAYRQPLTTMMYAVVSDWLTSNQLAGRGRMEDRIAFVIRDSLAGMIVQIASMLHGHDYAMQRAVAIRRYFHDDQFDEFLAEHN